MGSRVPRGAQPPRPTESFRWARHDLMVYSERLPIKYLLSPHGVCLGIDTHRCSYLFLVHRRGMILRRRPVGDRVVEDLDYHIPSIVRALRSEPSPPSAPYRESP